MATFKELAKVLGYDIRNQMFTSLAPGTDWRVMYTAESGEEAPMQNMIKPGADKALAGYDFSWTDTGPGNTGTLTATKDGQQVGSWNQQDTTTAQDLATFAALAGGMFGGLGLAGVGPLAGALGGTGAAGATGAGFVGEGVASGIPAWDAAAGLGGLGGSSVGLTAAELAAMAPAPMTAAQTSALLPALGGMGESSVALTAADIAAMQNAVPPVTAAQTQALLPALSGAGSALAPAVAPALGAAGGAAGGPTGGNQLAGKTIGDLLGSLSAKDWLSLGGNVLGGILQDKAGDAATANQLAGIRESNALQKQFFDQTRADYAPMREAANAGLAGYQALLKDPSAITKDPTYQLGLDQGVKTLQGSAIGRGGLYSGSTMKAIDKFGQDYAGTKLNDALGRQSTLFGMGTPGLSATTSLGQNLTNALSGNALTAGALRGANSVNSSNAYTGTLGNVMNYFQNQDIYRLLLDRKGG